MTSTDTGRTDKELQRVFEEAVWDASCALQEAKNLTCDSTVSCKNSQQDCLKRVINALTLLIKTATAGSDQGYTFHWVMNPIFEWQATISGLSWIPSNVRAQIKANFAWFTTNVKVEIKKDRNDPPGFTDVVDLCEPEVLKSKSDIAPKKTISATKRAVPSAKQPNTDDAISVDPNCEDVVEEVSSWTVLAPVGKGAKEKSDRGKKQRAVEAAEVPKSVLPRPKAAKGTIKKPVFKDPTPENPDSESEATTASEKEDEDTVVAVPRQPATPIYNERLHIRNTPKCSHCLPKDSNSTGYDCFRSKDETRGAPCCKCKLNNLACARTEISTSSATTATTEPIAGPSTVESPAPAQRKRAGTVSSDPLPKKRVRQPSAKAAASPPDNANKPARASTRSKKKTPAESTQDAE